MKKSGDLVREIKPLSAPGGEGERAADRLAVVEAAIRLGQLARAAGQGGQVRDRVGVAAVRAWLMRGRHVDHDQPLDVAARVRLVLALFGRVEPVEPGGRIALGHPFGRQALRLAFRIGRVGHRATLPRGRAHVVAYSKRSASQCALLIARLA